MAEKKKIKLSDVIGGKFKILGVEIDLGEALKRIEERKFGLETLSKALKEKAAIEGYLRTKSPLGDYEFKFGPKEKKKK